MLLLSKKISRVIFSKQTLGLGIFTLLTGGILVITNQLKPASSTMDHSGHNMSHDEMMAVDGSFNPTPVTVEVVKPELLQASVQYTGTIEPLQVVTVYPRVAGQLTDYSIYVGDRVQAGDTIAQLSANELLTEVLEAQAETNTMRTALEVSRMEVLEQKNVIKEIEANLTYLGKKLDRFALLVEEGAITQDAYDVVESEVQAKEANLAQAKGKLSRLEAKVVNDQAKIQQAETKVATASTLSNYREIKSPISGIVQERIIDPGIVVQPGMGILKIGDYSRIRLQANVAQQDAVNIDLASPITAKIAGTDMTINGKVSSIFPDTNSETRTVTVESIVNNPSGQLLSGQFINMEIITESQPNALTVPQSAVVTFEDSPAVWIVKGDNTAHRQNVKLGMISSDRVQVTEGLQSSDRVITTGNHQLVENASVKVINQGNNDLIATKTEEDQDNVAIKLMSPPEVKIGDAEFIFQVMDNETQQALSVKNIEIKATMPMKNMAPMTAEVEVKPQAETGTFLAETFLGMKGEWIISVEIKESEYQGKQEFNIEVR
ncbi:MAG: efflux RND transporter periplasmic adaptor subunit [Cyanobacteria bacterium]|jgi:multidrug efflux pump subunit AcrA (membrane-fusion protein)|nr:efflux RND transporter periplasmic adaptor subunit [Cyanobacteria bacterium GSL.Bin1]